MVLPLVLLLLLAACTALAVWSRRRARPADADRLRQDDPSRHRERRRGRRWIGRLRLGSRRRRPEPDPFAMLTVQEQLSRLAAHIRALDADPKVWARGRRMIAAQTAYDAVLAEACRMAGVDLDAGPMPLPLDEPERFREEIELAERGWSW